VAKLHLENMENVLSEFIFSRGILGETPLSRFPFDWIYTGFCGV